MSNLPPAARRQVREANRMSQALQAGQDPYARPAPAAPAPAPAAAQPANGQPTLQPVPNFVSVGAEIPPDARPVDPAAPAPVSAAPAPAPSEPPPDATAMPAPDTAEQRYRVLQGKYNKEVRQRDQQIATLATQNAQLLERIQTPPAAPVAAAVPLTLEQRAASLGLSKQELAEYGPELVDMIMRVATNITAPEIRRLAAEQQRLQGQVSQTVQNVNRTARELVYDALSTQIQNWEMVNDSQEFLDWLGQDDIFSGQTRNASLLRAFENNDATRVVGIFKAFLQEDARSRSTARVPQVDPATLVAPGQPAGSGTPAPRSEDQGKKIWLESEVGNFYSLVRQGKVKGDERKRIEADINLALVEGRIRPTINDSGIANAR